MKQRPTRYVSKIVLILALFCLLAYSLITTLVPERDDVDTALTEPIANKSAPLDEKAEIPKKKAPKPLSSRVVEYHISVQLDAAGKKLSGTQTMTWTNPGKKPVKELFFHLYPNAFRSKKSTFIRESGGKLRNDQMKKNTYGSMEITSLKTVDGEDLIHRMQFIQPDDGNKDDQTLLRLRLPQPVEPGKKITLHKKFTVQLPAAFARMGYVDDFVMAGQWFPKLCVYEPDGTRGRSVEGWNLHQYHGSSEFYSDFGIYNVQIQVPTNYMVAATGFPTKSAVRKGDSKTYHFYADDVHDFSWAASPHFIYVEEPYGTKHLPGVRIKLYLDPQHEKFKDRYIRAAKVSLARFSEWYGPYPYSTLSIVVPPQGGNGTGGMEYPTLITGWEASDKEPGLDLERVIVHEIGHQFFYGMVATNEFEEAWLDEGFTSYIEDKLMEEEYEDLSNTPLEASYITSPAPLKRHAWQYLDHDQYAANVYTRAKLVLKGIEMQIGSQKMNKVMKTYFERWKFKHPATKDFQKVVEQVTKKSWKSYFDQFVYGGLMVDYSVESIRSKKMEQDGKRVYENAVLITKRGGSYTSVPIVFHFADGTYTEKSWDGNNAYIEYKFTSKSPLDWVAIDPDYSLVLENKHMNNFIKAAVDEKWKIRWNLGVVKLLEALFGWVAW